MIRKLCALALLMTLPMPSSAEEPLVEKVRASIDLGIRYLGDAQKFQGVQNGVEIRNWETGLANAAWKGGNTCLAVIALTTAGMKSNDPKIQRALPYLRTIEPEKTYVVALQTMALAELNEPKDRDLIQRNVDWLLAARVRDGQGRLIGWSYGKGNGGSADNSNTQYALLGLLAGRQYGIKIDREIWQDIQDFYLRTQDNGGGWGYSPNEGRSPRHTMTVAGLCGLYIAGLELNQGQQKLDERTGIAANCAKYDETGAVAKGMKWLAEHFVFEDDMAPFYNVYGIERVGRLSGRRFLGEHDWYREGCELLTGVKASRKQDFKQHKDGYWSTTSSLDSIDTGHILSTSFALLFLGKGRMPILISKLAYDNPGSRPGEGLGWNNKHFDAKNVVEYCSKELFKKQPLAWQAFDPRMANLDTEKELNDETSNLLQSPILYINGHDAPQLTAKQKKLLRKFLDEGGFILAESCCGKQAFTDGFRKLMDEVLETKDVLQPMRPDHPVWSAHVPIDYATFHDGQADPRKVVQCVERGCKTVVVFTPIPLAGFWEEARFMPTAAPRNGMTRGELAYRFAGNVVAYATGLEPPRPRLDKPKITERKNDEVVGRHMMRIAQIRHDGDWHPAPMAMRNLAAHLSDEFRLDVALRKDELTMRSEKLAEHKFMYMHGRRAFTVEEGEVTNVRNNLFTGGILLADACCGSPEFDKGFRAFAAKLYPEAKLQPIDPSDELYGASINGTAIGQVMLRVSPDGTPEKEFKPTAPRLEGIKVDDRWVVIYSKYDLGCALEKSKSSACVGYDPAGAMKLASAAVLYSLKK